jgi:hypothetical protein
MLANTVSKFHSAGKVAFCVLSVHLKFHYAYSMNTHNRIMFEDLRHSHILKKRTVSICTVLCMCTVLFRKFSEYIEFHSTFRQSRSNESQYLEWSYFLPWLLKENYKLSHVDELLGARPTRKNFFLYIIYHDK